MHVTQQNLTVHSVQYAKIAYDNSRIKFSVIIVYYLFDRNQSNVFDFFCGFAFFFSLFGLFDKTHKYNIMLSTHNVNNKSLLKKGTELSVMLQCIKK